MTCAVVWMYHLSMGLVLRDKRGDALEALLWCPFLILNIKVFVEFGFL